MEFLQEHLNKSILTFYLHGESTSVTGIVRGYDGLGAIEVDDEGDKQVLNWAYVVRFTIDSE